MTEEKKRERIYWFCQLGGWSLYASVIISLFAPRADSRQRLAYMILSWVLTCGIGFSLTHLFRLFIKRSGWVSLRLPSLIPRIIAACVTLALAWELLALCLLFGLRFFRFSDVRLTEFLTWVFSYLFFWCAVLLIWSLIYFGLHYAENYRKAEVEKWRLEAAVKDQELRALKSQLNPHFIFNCLNSVRALIAEDPERAQTVVGQLANILRYSLQSRNTETVTLEDELQIVSDYLALEAVRLEDRLKVRMSIAPNTLDVSVPTMLIQTLVENGIKYGVATRPQGGEIRLTSCVQGAMLQIQVTNTGQLGNRGDSTGLGLRNATDRLRLLFGSSASLALESVAPDHVMARIEIPIKRHPSQPQS
jgi:two-component system, LytTR family, sensor kinase